MKIQSKLLFILMMSISPLLVFAETNPNDQTITATGSGEVSIPQTIATIQLTIFENGKNAKDVGQAVRVKANHLLQVLKASKTINLETTAVSVNPVMSYTNNIPKLTGYNASYSMQVKVLIPDAGGIIDTAMDNGANQINGPIMSASDSELAKAELAAIKLATLKARARADASLAALGLKAKNIRQITIQNNSRPAPLMARYAVAGVNADSSTIPSQIESGKDTVMAEVNVILSY